MVKKCILFLFACLLIASSRAQDVKTFRLYRPGQDASVEIEKIVSEAKTTGQHVFVQIGCNWCVWSARFNEFITSDVQIDSILKANYLVYHLNYPDKINKKLLEHYEYPQRFGFQVFVILDQNGRRLHTQNSAYLEQGKTYDREKIFEFLVQWSPAALNPNQYSF